MNIKEKSLKNLGITICLADLQDAEGVYTALLHNLVEIDDFNKLSAEKRKKLEEDGFLRKKVDVEYYKDLIKNPTVDVYIAKNKNGEICGFATLHKNEYDVKNVRDTPINLQIDDVLTEELLTSKINKFTYLDQISIIPKYQRKGIGAAILNKALEELKDPMVSFIVKVPLANKASAYWHEKNGFKLAATCNGTYKGVTFEWLIYIHWNK